VIAHNPDLDTRLGFLLLVPSEGRLRARSPCRPRPHRQPPPLGATRRPPPLGAIRRRSPRSTAAAGWSHPTPVAAAPVRRASGRSASTHPPMTSSLSWTASAPPPQESSALDGRVGRRLLRRPLLRVGRTGRCHRGRPLSRRRDPVASKIDDVLHAVRGPALERPRPTSTNHASHHRFRREHPAFHNPDIGIPEVEAYLDHDQVGDPPLRRLARRRPPALTGHARRQRPSRARAGGPTAGAAARPFRHHRRAAGPVPRRCRGRRPANRCASTTTRSSKAPTTTRLCMAPEERRRSPRTAADGSRSSAPPAGSWRAGRRHASHTNAWSKTRLLRRVPANAEAEQISQAHDPNQRGPRNDGKMAEPAAEHDLGRSLRVDMGPDGLRVACHPPGHG
jgi:hypothetical protein